MTTDEQAKYDRLREALTWAIGFIRCNLPRTAEENARRYPDWRNACDLIAEAGELFTGEFQLTLARAEVAEHDRERLAAAIREHRSQKADDRCIEDDDRLYAALGDGVKCDRRVGCKASMLENCVQFIRNRTEGGGPWVSYVELEAQRDRLRTACQLWDQGFTEGEEFDAGQFLRWVNANRKAAREALKDIT